MGIAVKELLAQEYFKDFHVIAGRRGLDREIQGITMLEAPDAFKWSMGKELIFSSGYVISQRPECIRLAFEEGNMDKSAALIIKRERYLPRIPEEIIALHEQYGVPLITMPFSIPWMEVMSQINVVVMNRTIRRFRIQRCDALQASQQTYKVQKIHRILQAVEVEMNFPAFLYDVNEGRGYYSSANFKRITGAFGLSEEDYWSPEKPHTVHTLCDYIQMRRIRLIDQENPVGPRVSWIQIPIVMNGATQAWFIVMESRELLDFYDEYAIRIAFLMIQGVYEQIIVAQNAGNIGFENFILYALNSGEPDGERLAAQASAQGISMSTNYSCVVFEQRNEDLSARSERKAFVEIFQSGRLSGSGRLVFLEENEGALILESGDPVLKNGDGVGRLLDDFGGKVGERFPGMRLEFGVYREERPLSEIRICIEKCKRAMALGRRLFPERAAWDYDSLGALAWLEIPEEELDRRLAVFRELLKDEKNAEILRTLKVYLENNMNYSVTAEKMYAHINTVRKRIDRAHELLRMDWEERMNRLNLELLLQFLEL